MIRRICITWEANKDGQVYDPIGPLHGILDRVVTVPDPDNPPTANYDVSLVNRNETDVLEGLLANRSASDVEQVFVYSASPAADRHAEVMLSGEYWLKIENARTATSGTVVVYVLGVDGV